MGRKGKTMQKQETTKSPFKRGHRIGLNFLNMRETTCYVKITGLEKDRENKQGGKNSFFNAENLETHETGLIYIDGGMKGNFNTIGGLEKAVGKSFEFTHKGKVEVEIDGEPVMVNTWDIFELEN